MEYFADSKLLPFIAGHRLLLNFLMLLDYTDFLKSGVLALKVVIIAVGGGLAVLGVVNLLEGRTKSGGLRLCADRSRA